MGNIEYLLTQMEAIAPPPDFPGELSLSDWGMIVLLLLLAAAATWLVLRRQLSPSLSDPAWIVQIQQELAAVESSSSVTKRELNRLVRRLRAYTELQAVRSERGIEELEKAVSSLSALRFQEEIDREELSVRAKECRRLLGESPL